MILYLIRHAIAEDRREGLADADRALTRSGRAKFLRAVKGMKSQGVRVDRLLYSPLRRAVDTAELLRPIVKGETIELPLLASPPSIAIFKEFGDVERVGCVGHQPFLSELLGLLVAGKANGGINVEIKKGGMAILEGKPQKRGMVLRGLFMPRDLRQMGATH